MKHLFLLFACLLALVTAAPAVTAQGVPPAPPADSTYETNEVTPAVAGVKEITVDVDGTTATSWNVWCWNEAESKWELFAKGPAEFQPAGTFTVRLQNALNVGTRYKVVGTTSGNSGPYDAEATL